jgi:hypothetical protein
MWALCIFALQYEKLDRSCLSLERFHGARASAPQEERSENYAVRQENRSAPKRFLYRKPLRPAAQALWPLVAHV